MDSIQMQIAVDVVTDLAKNFANYLYNRIKTIIIDKKAHDELYFQTAYEKYLYATKERNEKVKTLLYKQAPQYLYDFYECLGVKYKKKKIDTSDINNLFSVGHKLIVTGTGGIGKTTMMKHLFLNCIEKTDYIPILIELRSLNDKAIEDLDINEAIFESLTTFNFELERKYYDYSLSLGKYLFIFDGYDEVKSNLAKKIAESIQKLSNKYPDNYYIVSSRPLYNNFVAWSDFVELEAQGLSKEQALSLVKKLNYEKEIKSKFYVALKNNLYDKYKTFATNPLLLTIMLMTFAEGAEIPENFNDFYEQAFIALYKAHDASKGAYIRDKAAKLGSTDFKLIFSYVCFKSYFASKYEFNESEILDYIAKAKAKCKIVDEFKPEDFLKDLTDSVCMLVWEGLTLRFTHRSFQEYFAAYYTTQLDDQTQEKLIRSWLYDSYFARSSEFLNMLNRMEPDRFEKNILYPGLKEIKKACKDIDRIEILKLFFNQIALVDEERFDILLSINNNYFFTIHSFLRKKMKEKKLLTNRRTGTKETNALYLKLLEKGYKPIKKSEIMEINVDDIIEDQDLKEVLKLEFSDIFSVFDFGMDLLEKWENTSISNKRKLSSILEDL